MEYTVLAADDELELLDVLDLYLSKEGIRLLKAGNGRDALALFRTETVHLLLLDIMMPELDGYGVLQEVRKTSSIPVIILSARAEDHEKILGLELGADDYIAKPFNPMEATARIKAQLRRTYSFAGQDSTTATYAMHGLVLDTGAGTLTKEGELVPLTSTEYKILGFLMGHPGRVFTRRQIYEAVWGDSYLENDSSLMMHLSNLRAKIEDDPRRPEIIITIKGLGYKIEKPR
ncbi:MAG: response regulator transcription factor [Propionibacteriaceae bacterium]|jgi:DNA-binding response OmpR family regulator|nr:response regulator transcription factor [Propionibacteriaceae bacterium]